MFKYKLYDLAVTSCLEFKFLEQTSFFTSPDVEILEDHHLPKIYKDVINKYDAYIFRKDIGFFHIQAGKKISFNRQDSKVSDENLTRSMINAVFGYLLYQRGYFVLHASALKLGVSSFTFLGRSGSGKSSLIADLSINYGADFICEDVACISNIEDIALINAPPLIKLSREISHTLNLDQKNKLNLISDRLNRSFYKVQENTNTNKLNACFFLEWGDSFSIEKLEDSRVLPVFLLSTYSCYPFNSCIESSRDFHNFVHAFIKKVPIFKITRNKEDGFKNSIEVINFLKDLIK